MPFIVYNRFIVTLPLVGKQWPPIPLSLQIYFSTMALFFHTSMHKVESTDVVTELDQASWSILY